MPDKSATDLQQGTLQLARCGLAEDHQRPDKHLRRPWHGQVLGRCRGGRWKGRRHATRAHQLECVEGLSGNEQSRQR